MRARAVRIDDIHDPRLAPYAGVGKPESLVDRGLVLVEGRFVVRRLLDSRRVRFVSLLVNDAALRALEDVLERTDQPLEVYLAPPAVINAITGINIHRGCLAVAKRPHVLSMATFIPVATFVARRQVAKSTIYKSPFCLSSDCPRKTATTVMRSIPDARTSTTSSTGWSCCLVMSMTRANTHFTVLARASFNYSIFIVRGG